MRYEDMTAMARIRSAEPTPPDRPVPDGFTKAEFEVFERACYEGAEACGYEAYLSSRDFARAAAAFFAEMEKAAACLEGAIPDAAGTFAYIRNRLLEIEARLR